MQGVVGGAHRYAELVTEPLVEAAQQRPTTGEGDPAVDDVAGQLGGQTSSTVRTSSTICTTGASMARRTSAEPIDTVLGSPVTRSRPRTRPASSSRRGKAEPAPILRSSALRSPSSREYWLFTWATSASSISSPPIRTVREVTTPPRLRMATSVVPPPTSTTIDARVSSTGRPAPIAAAIVSSMT